MTLIWKIVNIRRQGDDKAVDVLWRASDGSILRGWGVDSIICSRCRARYEVSQTLGPPNTCSKCFASLHIDPLMMPATEIQDQVNVSLDATDDQILEAIEKKKIALTEALGQPGIGITLDPIPMTDNSSLIGKESQ